jgi:type IV fimbrial biogenesis protein FimT
MSYSVSRGLSLLELVTTMAVSTILFTVAIPVLGEYIQQNRIANQINQLRTSLALTRSEAVKENEHAVICKSGDGKTCTRKGGWNQGWIVFIDNDHNRRRSGNERLVHVQQSLPEGFRVEYRAFGSRNYVTYRPIGYTKTNGTFTVCNPRVPRRSKALILTKTGRVRLSDRMPGGKPIKCGPGG